MVLNREIPIVMVLGVIAWLAPSPRVSVWAGWAMVAVLILTPIGRIGWLASRWIRFDRRYGWVAWGLLTAVGVVAVLAALLR